MDNDRLSQKLVAAVTTNDLGQVRQALADGASPNSCDLQGKTALSLALDAGEGEIAELLLAAGADALAETSPVISGTIPGDWSFNDLMSQSLATTDARTQQLDREFGNSIDMLATNTAPSHSQDPEIDANLLTDILNNLLDDEGDEDTQKSLVAAVLDGDVEAVQNLIASGIDLNEFDRSIEGTALSAAIENHRYDLAEMLLDAGASPDLGDARSIPLSIAARNGNDEIFRLLLEAGANPNCGMENDHRAIIDAALYGRLAMVKLLAENGADVNALSQGETAITIAARHGHRDIYDYLYPLVDAETRAEGERGLQAAIERIDIKIQEDIDSFISAATFGKLSAVREAIANGIDVNAIGSNHQTALMYAAHYGHLDIVEALLDAGADPNILSDGDGGLGEGMTALMHVAGSLFARNREIVAQLLIDRGAKIDLQGTDGRTALMYGLNYAAVVQMLIEAGANLDLRDRDRNSALMLATAAKYDRAIDLLTAAGASPVGLRTIRLILAVESENLAKVKKSIAAGANYNHQDGRALNLAASNGNREIVMELIKAGADVNLGGKSGFTPLASAAYAGWHEIVRILLDAGADASIKCFDGESKDALGYAQIGQCEGHHPNGCYAEVIELLTQAKATEEPTV